MKKGLVKPGPMLREVTANNNGQLIKSIEVRYLSMFPDHIAVNHLELAQVLKYFYGPPECGHAAPESLADRGRFGINQAVIGPQPEEP